jgi:hypothetical protein
MIKVLFKNGIAIERAAFLNKSKECNFNNGEALTEKNETNKQSQKSKTLSIHGQMLLGKIQDIK